MCPTAGRSSETWTKIPVPPVIPMSRSSSALRAVPLDGPEAQRQAEAYGLPDPLRPKAPARNGLVNGTAANGTAHVRRCSLPFPQF